MTMPMPASTFTLAVGHWQQVPAEIPSVLEGDVGDSEEQDEPAKLGAGPGRWTEAECVLGSSTSEVVKGTPPQTGRYWVIFPPVSFFPLLQTVDPRLSLQHYRHLNFPRAKLIVQLTIWVVDGGGREGGGVALHQLLMTSTLHLAKCFYGDFNGLEELSLELERRGWHLFYGGAGRRAEAGPLNGTWLWSYWAGVFHAAGQQVGRSARSFQ